MFLALKTLFLKFDFKVNYIWKFIYNNIKKSYFFILSFYFKCPININHDFVSAGDVSK